MQLFDWLLDCKTAQVGVFLCDDKCRDKALRPLCNEARNAKMQMGRSESTKRGNAIEMARCSLFARKLLLTTCCMRLNLCGSRACDYVVLQMGFENR